MFSLTNYLLFPPAVLVITLLPGPDFAIVVKTALLCGRHLFLNIRLVTPLRLLTREDMDTFGG
ncbi:hypothetical protein [Sutterella wadsworthensis]|uniref:hypothetical protein n=1 Tax=Sutterella wadsworthensis TaxID=40545 RepID=UPI001F0F753B|nr:hypothetical protein [Sutterella wadsworthensis]